MKHVSIDQIILKLVKDQLIGDQHQLAEKLVESGFNVTQSTLSRKLRKLGISKVHGFYKITELAFSSLKMVREIIQSPPNLIVLKTLPGHANAVAFQLDSHDLEGAAGTIAGDDAVFIALKEGNSLDGLQKSIEDLIEG